LGGGAGRVRWCLAQGHLHGLTIISPFLM